MIWCDFKNDISWMYQIPGQTTTTPCLNHAVIVKRVRGAVVDALCHHHASLTDVDISQWQPYTPGQSFLRNEFIKERYIGNK